MLTGIMNAEHLDAVYEAGLNLSLMRGSQMDIGCTKTINLSTHPNNYVEEFLEQRGVNWWYTPPESPDMNPIELVWGSLKHYLRNHFKLKNLEEFKASIEQFWLILTLQVCIKYIRRLSQGSFLLEVALVDTNRA